jgi:signal transduction histidine kinase
MQDNVGLGLGLAIVKKILEVHEIAINVESDKEKGTVFSFKVPIYHATKTIDTKVNV